MSDRFTEIHLPRSPAAWVERGEQSAEAMVHALREYANGLRAQADAVERAADHEFQIQSYSGIHVQRNRREIQRSSRLLADGASSASTTEGSKSPGMDNNNEISNG